MPSRTRPSRAATPRVRGAIGPEALYSACFCLTSFRLACTVNLAVRGPEGLGLTLRAVSYTHLRAHETRRHL
eukprot:9420713-Prorocentrum_lima.AAC.1